MPLVLQDAPVNLLDEVMADVADIKERVFLLEKKLRRLKK